MVTGINHVTLAVGDLERAFAFYTGVLQLTPVATWTRGAYLLAGEDWICLSLDPAARTTPHPDYTHLAFSVAPGEFEARVAALRAHGAVEWKQDRSEGASLYVLDPDGHKLELHVGDLHSRLAALAAQPYEGLRLHV